MRIRRLHHRAALLAFSAGFALPASAAPNPDGAGLVFSEAKVICDRDRGALWGRGLCGPILIVDPMDKAVIANQADAGGALKPAGATFTGTLPEAVIIADTPTEWSGTRWTQLTWPVSFETMNRRVTLAHELFHRIQPALGLTRPEVGNQHLDTLEGRYLLQLEWRALARGLTAISPSERRDAIEDALAFRRKRHSLFPKAAAEEGALEINEGVPEYTGVMLGLATPQERIAYAVYDLSRFVESSSFVRSFAYATGPAYGLLLDQTDPGWRAKLASGRHLDELLTAAVGLAMPSADHLEAREARYDDGTLRAREERRDADRRARLADFKARLVDGPVLSLPIAHGDYQFNPQTLIPLEGFGTIYPSMRITDDWGALEVEDGGALIWRNPKRATVSAKGMAASGLAGPGWRLTLKPGWTIRPGTRTGDFEVAPPSTPRP